MASNSEQNIEPWIEQYLEDPAALIDKAGGHLGCAASIRKSTTLSPPWLIIEIGLHFFPTISVLICNIVPLLWVKMELLNPVIADLRLKSYLREYPLE